MFRCVDNKTCDGNDGQARGEEDPRVRLRPSVLKHDGDRDKDEKPVDRHVKFPAIPSIKLDQRCYPFDKHSATYVAAASYGMLPPLHLAHRPTSSRHPRSRSSISLEASWRYRFSSLAAAADNRFRSYPLSSTVWS